ncbi:hypothetical protein [Sneathia sanguinegens]|uniref:hypothetical protein n=1 Tax=Sneathia sanguinegens TaxID=40543 RepID=UPI0023F6963F|nr:hypothetical protein [Sneathia sanguinegens]
MKKTILLSTLLASVALASTTGFVESYIENETEFGTYEKKLLDDSNKPKPKTSGVATQSTTVLGKKDPNQKKPTEKKDEQKFGLKEHKTKLGVKTQVNIENTGFSFGAEIKGKDLKLFKFADDNKTISLQDYLTDFDDNSNVWAKLTLPEYNNFIMSGKLKVGAKYKNKKYVVPVTGEAEFKTMYEENTFKFLTKTTFDANKDFKAYEDIRSEHTISVETAHPIFKNSKLSFSVEHDYGQDPETAVKVLRGQALVYYNAFDKLSLDARSYFKYKFGAKKFKYIDFMLEKNDQEDNSIKHLESVIGEATYKANTKTNLIGKLFIQHFKNDDAKHDLKYGAILGVKYNNRFGMNVDFNNIFAATSSDILDKDASKTLGYWKTKLGLKYNINAINNKLIVSPELVLSASVDKFDYTKVKDGFKMLKGNTGTAPAADPTNGQQNPAPKKEFDIFFANAEVEPKLTVAYKPVNSLTLTGFVSAPIKFTNVKGKDENAKSTLSIYYTQVVKSGLNIKYVW